MLNRYYRRVKRNRLIWLSAGVILMFFLCVLLFYHDLFAPYGVASPMYNPRIGYLEEVCAQTDKTSSVYVEIKDRTIYYAGFRWGTKNQKRDVYLLHQSGKWVILLLGDSIATTKQEHFSGFFTTEYDTEETEELVEEVVGQYTFNTGLTSPIVLNQTNFYPSIILFSVYIIVLLVVLVIFAVCLVQMIDPKSSKTIRQLACYGPVEECIASIQDELANASRSYPIYTKSWIFSPGGFAMLRIVPIHDIVWYHQSNVSNVMNGDSYGLVFYCYSQKKPVIFWSTSRGEIEEMKELKQYLDQCCPFIDSAFSEEKGKLFRQDREAFLRLYGRREEQNGSRY